MKIKEIIRRLIIGSLMGAFIGLLELWFYGFNLRHGIAAILAGGFFGAVLGVFGSMLTKLGTALILCGSVGAVAGAVWWFAAKSSVSIFQSIAIGIVLGLLFVWGEGTWNQKSKSSYNNGIEPDTH